MTKLLCTAVLFAGMAGLVTTSTISVAPAQDKKDTKKAAPAGKTGTIEINQGKDEKYRFAIRDAEGKYLAGSSPSGFEKREDAVKALETLKDVLSKATVTSPPKKDAPKTDK